MQFFRQILSGILAALAMTCASGQTLYEIRRLNPPPDTFRPGEMAALSPIEVNNRGEVLLDNAEENRNFTGQKGAVMARWSTEADSRITYRRIVASVPKHPTDLTWAYSRLSLVALNDNGTAVGWETYEGLVNATFENAGAARIQELGLFHDLVALDPDATVPRRLGYHTYVGTLSNDVVRWNPLAIGVNNQELLLGRYPITHRLTGAQLGGDFLGSLGGGGYSFLRELPTGGALDLNDRGQVIGVLPSGVPALWNPGFRHLHDVTGYRGSGTMVPARINLHGEIAGAIREGTTNKLFLWLPRAAYGLGPGLHTLYTAADTGVTVYDLNDNGNILWTYGTAPNNNLYLWSERSSIALRQLVSSGEGLIPRRGGNWSINDRGWIAGWGVTSQGQQAVPIVMRPVADAEVFLSTNRIAVGDTFTFTLRVRNLTSTPRNLGLPIGFRFNGTARFQLVGASTPTGSRTVPAFGSFEVHQQIRATSVGVSAWSSQGRLIGGGTTNDTPVTYSQPIHVVNFGDVLIKRAVEPEAMYSGNDLYEGTPTGAQMRLVAQGPGETNRFSVRLQNDAPQPAAFDLRVTAGPSPADWRVSVRDAASNILANVLTAGGWRTPTMAPGASLDLSLEISDVSAKDRDQVTVTASLSNPGEAEVVDSVAAVVSREPVPIEIGLRRVESGGYTAGSIQAGRADADAPLELVADAGALLAQPWIRGGWVADGVTPLLLQVNSFPGALALHPEGREFRLDLGIESGGSLEGRALAEGLRLLRNGGWVPTNRFTLTADAPTAFVTLPPVAADALKLSAARELVLSAAVTDVVSQRVVQQFRFRLRKPPVVLIHGYNTTGDDWEDAFMLELSRSRPLPVDEPGWVRVARYGQAREPGRSPYVSQLVNTLWPLADLVPLAEQAFEEAVAPLREQWAFTRYDAVCHSQGGLLTRMLCSERTSRTLTRPFRNELNHYRGRFHRVVTIGSPHNGTRLLRYLLALDESRYSSFKNSLPLAIGKAGVLLEIAQEKFDPFGVQIRDLNNPSPDSRWKPDPAAKFHLVRTTINRGGTPSPYDEPPSPPYLLLGLLHPLAGPAVLPRGSDGVVDFDSMGGHGPNQVPDQNVFQLSPELLVSHCPPPDVFGAGVGQTASPHVGAHVIAALDQDPAVPASHRAFGSFRVPELLEDAIRGQIDHWASAFIFEYVASAIRADQNAGPQGPEDGGAQTLRYALTLPPHLPAIHRVVWTVETLGAAGLRTEPGWLSVNPTNSLRVTVQVPGGFVGDVVLHASALATNGTLLLVEPRRIYSAAPTNASMIGIVVEPNRAALPVGSEVPVELWARYSDGSVIQRHVTAEELTASSGNTSVLVATNSTRWRWVGPGTAIVVVNYQGLCVTNEITAYVPGHSDAPTLRFRQIDPGSLELSWSPSTPGFVLQSVESLSMPSWTNAPSGTNNPAVIPTAMPTRFYRLSRP